MRPPVVPTRGWLRLLRGTTVAAVSTALTVLGHAAAGGAMAGLGTLVVLGALMAVLMTALADRRAGPGAILVTIGAAQVAMHLLMQLMAGHPHAATGAVAVRPVPMIVVHLAATVVSAALLAHLEHLVFWVAAALNRVRPRRLSPLPVPGLVPALLPASTRSASMRSLRYAIVVGQRGPPVPG